MENDVVLLKNFSLGSDFKFRKYKETAENLNVATVTISIFSYKLNTNN